MTVLPWVADVLVVLGLLVMTIGVYGIFRMPDVYTQLHAASKAVFLGVIALLAASVASRDPEIVARAVLIGALLVVTTPVAAHAVARAAYVVREPMRTPGAIDETGRLLFTRTRRDDGTETAVRRIVVGYDGSDVSRRALERAARLAGQGGAVTVVTAGSLLPQAPGRASTTEEEAEHRRVLEEARALLGERGVETQLVEGFGDPAETIIQTAEEQDADLIVIGTRGRGAAARVLLGSVSTAVVNRASCDVLVVR